ncbi:MAG: Ig-like domain-containing protein [Chloroflexales bacterium]
MRMLRHVLLIIALIFPILSTSPTVAAPMQLPLLAVPTNDDFDTPLAITTFPASNSLDTSAATLASDDPLSGCGSGLNNASVWYRLVIPGKGRVTINTVGSGYDTVLAVYTGTRGTLSSIGCNDDAAGARTSSLSFSPQGSTTYWLEVSAYGSGSGGSLIVSVNFQAAIATPLDIMLLQDETGSMGDDIASLQQLVPAVWDGVAGLTSVQFRMGVAGFRDYARPAWGNSSDWVYRPIGSPTSDRADFAQMLSYLTAAYGGDGPEASYPAITYMLTADHPCIDSDGNGSCADSIDTAPGLQPIFRSGARRVLLLATDSPSHMPADTLDYPGPNQDAIISLLQQTRTVVIGLVPGGAGTIPSIDEIAAASGGSVQNTGATGSAVADAIIAAISDLKPVSPALSTLSLSATTAPADGTTTVDVHVVLRDTAGRPVSGRTVQITSQRGVYDSITQPTESTDSNGEVVGTISSTTPGDVLVSAIDISDNVALESSASLSFTAVNAQLRDSIVSSNRTTRTYLDAVGKAITNAGDDGDYFIGAVTSDAAALATGLFLDTAKVLGGVKDTVGVARSATYLAYPGTASDEGWSAIGRLHEAFPKAGDLFNAAVQNSVQNEAWTGMSLTVLKGGINYYAAGLFSEAIDQYGLDRAEDFLAALASQRGGLPQIASYGHDSVSNLESMAATERDRILSNLPTLSPEQERIYIEDIAKRTRAAITIGAAYDRQSQLLDSLRGAHETVGNDGLVGVFLRFAASSTAGAAFDGPGKLIVDGLIGSFDTYINTRKLSESGRGVILAQGLIKGGPEAASRIYGNTVGGYERIQRELTPTPLNAHIVSIHNYTQGRGFGPIWLEENSYSDLEIANDSDTSATFEVFADFGYTSKIFFGIFPYAFMPMSETEVMEIPAHSTGTVRIYYRQGSRGGSPADDRGVQFSVLASMQSDNSLRLAASQGVIWQNLQRVHMDGSLASTLAGDQPQQTFENPVSSYVLVDTATQTYQVQLWMSNPFTATVTADISQQLPTGVTVIATDGDQSGDTIRWQRNIDASNLISATVTFRMSTTPGSSVQLPAATMSFVEPASKLQIMTSSNSPTFQALWPLAADWIIPQGSTGLSATLPLTLTNYLAESLSGQIVVKLTGPGSVQPEVVTPFRLNAASVGTTPVALPIVAYPGLYDLSIEIRLPGAGSLIRRGVYDVSGQVILPSHSVYLPILQR